MCFHGDLDGRTAGEGLVAPCLKCGHEPRLKDTQGREAAAGAAENELRKAERTMAEDQAQDRGTDRGRYVQGAYGKAGTEPGHHATESQGQYTEGDYGRGGTEGADPEAAEGRFVEADYGTAGDVPGHDDKDPKGEYITGDYGEAGGAGD